MQGVLDICRGGPLCPPEFFCKLTGGRRDPPLQCESILLKQYFIKRVYILGDIISAGVRQLLAVAEAVKHPDT